MEEGRRLEKGVGGAERVESSKDLRVRKVSVFLFVRKFLDQATLRLGSYLLMSAFMRRFWISLKTRVGRVKGGVLSRRDQSDFRSFLSFVRSLFLSFFLSLSLVRPFFLSFFLSVLLSFFISTLVGTTHLGRGSLVFSVLDCIRL